jgi:hypothetical protein
MLSHGVARTSRTPGTGNSITDPRLQSRPRSAADRSRRLLGGASRELSAKEYHCSVIPRAGRVARPMKDYLVKSGEYPVLEVDLVNREIRMDDDVPD